MPQGPDHPREEDLMNRLLGRIARSARTLTLALPLLFLCGPTTRAQAQFFGGYGFPGYGYGMGMGFPGYGYGMGYGLGYGFGYPPYSEGYLFNGAGVTMAVPGPFGVYPGYGSYGYGASNPLFGLGLTPLGVNSAIAERYILGRGLSGYSSGYGGVAVPRTGNVGVGTGIGTGTGTGTYRP
jgi:hypothetical protein